MKNSYILYESFHAAGKNLSDEKYGKYMRIINEYALYGNEPEITDNEIYIAFTLIRPQIDANNKRWEDGFKGGRPKKTTGFETEKPVVFNSENQWLENEKPNVNVNVNQNVNENQNVVCKCIDKDNNNNNFAAPTFKEVEDFCAEQNLKISPEYFFTYYTARNWEGVKDWKLCCLGWNKNQKEPVENKNRKKYLKQTACPTCSAKKIFWDDGLQIYHCDSCNNDFPYEAI